MANTLSVLNAPEFIKMYGFTLSIPQTLVLESTKGGPLDMLLKSNKSVSTVALIEASHTLAKALLYLVS